MANTVKVPAEKWLEAAEKALIKDGHAGVKVDRLAKTLHVTRGGFYHHFDNHQDLLDKLIKRWTKSNDFLPKLQDVSTPSDAVNAFRSLIDHLISEKEFSPAFEMAIREWARVNSRVSRTVDRIDKRRISKLSVWFEALGCDKDEADIRARVIYFHQIGYYNLGYHKRESKEERRKSSSVYLRILCGRQYADAAARQKAA